MSAQATEVEKRCRVEGCKRPYRAKSYCNVHYRQWRHGKLGKSRYKICSKAECLGKREAMGLCASHLNEWRAARGKGEQAGAGTPSEPAEGEAAKPEEAKPEEAKAEG